MRKLPFWMDGNIFAPPEAQRAGSAQMQAEPGPFRSRRRANVVQLHFRPHTRIAAKAPAATDVTASPDHAGLRSGCSADRALPGSRSFPGAHHFGIGPSSFVRDVPSEAAWEAKCRFDPSDESRHRTRLAFEAQ